MTGNNQNGHNDSMYLWHDYMRHCDSLGDEKEEETVGIYIIQSLHAGTLPVTSSAAAEAQKMRCTPTPIDPTQTEFFLSTRHPPHEGSQFWHCYTMYSR